MHGMSGGMEVRQRQQTAVRRTHCIYFVCPCSCSSRPSLSASPPPPSPLYLSAMLSRSLLLLLAILPAVLGQAPAWPCSWTAPDGKYFDFSSLATPTGTPVPGIQTDELYDINVCGVASGQEEEGGRGEGRRAQGAGDRAVRHVIPMRPYSCIIHARRHFILHFLCLTSSFSSCCHVHQAPILIAQREMRWCASRSHGYVEEARDVSMHMAQGVLFHAR